MAQTPTRVSLHPRAGKGELEKGSSEEDPFDTPRPRGGCLGGFRRLPPPWGSPGLLQAPFYRGWEGDERQTAAKVGTESRNLCAKVPALPVLARKSPRVSCSPPPKSRTTGRREGAGARGGSHQYVDVLLLVQQRPHLLDVAVEDGLDQRRLPRDGEAGAEGGTAWRTRHGQNQQRRARRSRYPSPELPGARSWPTRGARRPRQLRGPVCRQRRRFSRLAVAEEAEGWLEKPLRFPRPSSGTSRSPGWRPLAPGRPLRGGNGAPGAPAGAATALGAHLWVTPARAQRLPPAWHGPGCRGGGGDRGSPRQGGHSAGQRESLPGNTAGAEGLEKGVKKRR